MNSTDRFCDHIESVGEANTNITRAIDNLSKETENPETREVLLKVRALVWAEFRRVHDRFMTHYQED